MQDDLDEKLALRLRLFRDTGQVRPEVTEFVEHELRALARGGLPVTEETAGMLASHLMTALNRLLNGEAIDDAAAGRHMAAELAGQDGAVQLAQQIARRAQQALGAGPLPRSETSYLAMHLAVLRQRGPAAGAGGSAGEGMPAGQNTPVRQNGEQP